MQDKTKIPLIIVFAVVGVIGGFFLGQWYTNNHAKTEVVKTSPTPKATTSKKASTEPSGTTSASPSATKSADPYDGWKTFTDNTVGYKLRYPGDWTIKQVNNYNETIQTDVRYVKITTPDEKYFLHVGVKNLDNTFATSDRTGIGAGDLKEDDSMKVTILGIGVTPKGLYVNDKMKELFFNQPSGSSEQCYCNFTATFSYTDKVNYDELNIKDSEYLPKVKLILQSIGWM